MVELRDFSENHLNATYRWINDPLLRRSFLFTRKVTPESHKNWFATLGQSETERIYAIHAGGNHVGNIGLKNIELNERIAETWIYLGERDFQSKGVAQAAYQVLFSKLSHEGLIDDLYCHVASFNAPSIGLFTKLGFVRDADFKLNKDSGDEVYELYKFKKHL